MVVAYEGHHECMAALVAAGADGEAKENVRLPLLPRPPAAVLPR